MAWRRPGGNADILSIGTLRTNLSEILNEIRAFSFRKIHLKMSSAKWRQFCLILNVLHSNSSFYCGRQLKFMPTSTNCFLFYFSCCSSLVCACDCKIWRRQQWVWQKKIRTLQWRHNGLDSVSNHLPRHCLLSRLFRGRSKKTLKLRVTDLCAENSRGTGEFPHKWPVTQKMVPFDDVIMII